MTHVKITQESKRKPRAGKKDNNQPSYRSKVNVQDEANVSSMTFWSVILYIVTKKWILVT